MIFSPHSLHIESPSVVPRMSIADAFETIVLFLSIAGRHGCSLLSQLNTTVLDSNRGRCSTDHLVHVAILSQ